jgi:hypothetical protein
VIREFPNGETSLSEPQWLGASRGRTWRSKTFQ